VALDIIMLMSYYFYLARCSDNSLYCGSCVDLDAREDRHNSGKGAKYTRSRKPVKIVYFEEYSTLPEARRREAQVKTQARGTGENVEQNQKRKPCCRQTSNEGLIQSSGSS